MASDPRIPGVQLKDGEKVVLAAKIHGIEYFRFKHIFIIPLIITFLQIKNALLVVTTQRVIK